MANRKGRPATNVDSRHISFRITKANFDWLKEVCEKNNIPMTDVLQTCVTNYRSERPKVKIKDYEKDVHYLLLALQGVGINVDYITTDLIKKCIDTLSEKGKEMSLMDMCKLKVEHKEKWDAYFINKNNENESE